MSQKTDTTEDAERTVPDAKTSLNPASSLSFEHAVELRLKALVEEQKEQNLRIEILYKRMDSLLPRIERLLAVTNKTLKMYQREHASTVLRQKNIEETVQILLKNRG